MNEATITSELIPFIRERNDGGPVIKHADKATIGVPDISITGGHQTQWIEVKFVRVGKKKRMFDLAKIIQFGGPQYRTVTHLDYHGAGAFYVIFFNAGRNWWTWIATGVGAGNLCRQLYQINLASLDPLRLFSGKAFGEMMSAIQKRRTENDLL